MPGRKHEKNKIDYFEANPEGFHIFSWCPTPEPTVPPTQTTKLSEHDMLVTLATMALRMDDLTGHDVLEALREHGYGAVVAKARNELLENEPNQITMTTEEPVDAWRKCQLWFKVPLDSAIVGHELDASEGASILSGTVLESIRPVLRAGVQYPIRIANGRLPQRVSLTLILEKP